MIKGRVIPGRRVMALLASRRETRLHVIRAGRTLEILYVARRAVGRRSHKLAVRVALGASHVGVRTGQRELRKGIVVECCRIPGTRAVTSLASRRESSLRMRRIIGLVEIRHVATHAIRRRGVESSARMTRAAVQGRVRPGQREIRGWPGMIKLRPQPVVHGVALLTPGGKPEPHVVKPG